LLFRELTVNDEAALWEPIRGSLRDGWSGRLRARHVVLPRVLHPGPGRLRHRVARPPARSRASPPGRAGGGTRSRLTRRGETDALSARTRPGHGATVTHPRGWVGARDGTAAPRRI